MVVQRLFTEIAGASEYIYPGSQRPTIPIQRGAGGYAIYDDTRNCSTCNPGKSGHRGWIAYLPDGRPLQFLVKHDRWKSSLPRRVVRRFSTPEKAIAALDLACLRLSAGAPKNLTRRGKIARRRRAS